MRACEIVQWLRWPLSVAMIGHHGQMQVTEERVYLGLRFQRDESLPLWGHREARGKHCSGGRMGELTSPTTAQSAENKLEVWKPLQSQRQAPSLKLPTEDQVLKCLRLWRTFLIQTILQRCLHPAWQAQSDPSRRKQNPVDCPLTSTACPNIHTLTNVK